MNDRIPRLSPVMASRANQVLVYIRLYHQEYGIGPSLSEIAAAIGANRSRAHDAVRTLAREGRIIHVPGQRRGVRPNDPPVLDVIFD